MTILGLAESFKTMNRSDPIEPSPTVMLFDSSGVYIGGATLAEDEIYGKIDHFFILWMNKL